MISPIRYEVEIHDPLSTPVPMPPSMLSSEALVIWMFRIAMNDPIMAASTAIHTVALARSGSTASDPVEEVGSAAIEADGVRLDMARSIEGRIGGNIVRDFRCAGGVRCAA